MDVAASQLVQTALAKIAQAELALFKVGQVLEAVVVKSAADGAATLRIGDLLVAAQAPEPLPQGATVELLVKSGGAVPQLTLMRPASAEAPAPKLWW